ncbi:SDR family oxidoreductase [Streptosporangium canum]|uniref:SDR family oxidoreductase n=1 Tax=Streptosporangium canum TaxID=324952 RepID=UPI00368808AA
MESIRRDLGCSAVRIAGRGSDVPIYVPSEEARPRGSAGKDGRQVVSRFGANTKVPLFITQRALPLLNDGGRIVKLSTAATRTAIPEQPYAMSKAAIEVLGRSLAQLTSPRARRRPCGVVSAATPGRQRPGIRAVGDGGRHERFSDRGPGAANWATPSSPPTLVRRSCKPMSATPGRVSQDRTL